MANPETRLLSEHEVSVGIPMKLLHESEEEIFMRKMKENPSTAAKAGDDQLRLISMVQTGRKLIAEGIDQNDLRIVHGIEAEDLLIKENGKLIRNTMKRISRDGKFDEDMFQSGRLALMMAIRNFDFEKGSRFVDYAAKSIRNGIRYQISTSIGMHINQYNELRMVNNAIDNDCIDDYVLISEKTGLGKVFVINLLRFRRRVSLQQSNNHNDKDSYPVVNYVKSDVNVEEQAILNHLLGQIYGCLTQREKMIFESLLDGKTQENLAKELFYTRQNISLIQRGAIKKIKEYFGTDGVKSLLG